jgi:hypothetical protein
MMVQTTLQFGQRKSKSRVAWAREGGARRRYSSARLRAALRARLRAGWIPVVPSGGSHYERITVLCPNHALAAVARAYVAGERRFDRTVVEGILGCRLDSRSGADALAAAGLAMLWAEGERLELRAADPRVAQLVNRARLGLQRRGYDVHRVIEAFLALPPMGQRRRAATDDRRLEVARMLQDDWFIDGDDLLNCRPFARLRSLWIFQE